MVKAGVIVSLDFTSFSYLYYIFMSKWQKNGIELNIIIHTVDMK